MWQQQVSRTRARRGWAVNSFWIACLILGASAIAATMLIETAPLIVTWVVAGVAGLVSGLLLGWRARSRWSLIRAVATPITVAVPLGLLGVGLSQTAEDVGIVAGGIASLLVLWEAPLLVGYTAASWRSREETVGAPVAATLDRELDAATAGATVPLVIREYVDDDDGQRHLARDTDALSARGYHVVSVERGNSGSILADLLSGGSSSDPRIVATFQLEGWEPPTGSTLPRADYLRSVYRGIVELIVIIAWVLGAMIVSGLIAGAMAAAMGEGEFNRANLGGPLLVGGLAVAVLASFLTPRWFRRRNS